MVKKILKNSAMMETTTITMVATTPAKKIQTITVLEQTPVFVFLTLVEMGNPTLEKVVMMQILILEMDARRLVVWRPAIHARCQLSPHPQFAQEQHLRV